VPLVPGNQTYLERPRIDRLLEKAVRHPIVLVTGGAGYGKTHAVYSFLHKYDVVTTWMQLSERDNIPERFWENFTGAVAMFSTKTAERLMETGFPETERQFDRYMHIPNADVIPNWKYIFVYDDFHLIQNEKVLRYTERSILAFFPNITSILISRTDPLQSLTALAPKGNAARITEDDLRFTRTEMVECFSLHGVHADTETMDAIYRDTEGWAFAIHLTALSLKNAPAGARYIRSTVRSNLFKLIERDIIAVISKKLRKYLIKLSLIDYLPPELLEEISGGHELIEEMEDINSFIQFDSYRNVFRIHHLFLEYLSGKQQELTADEKEEVYIKAAEWCSKNNHKIDAINYYERAAAYGRFLDTIYTLPLILPKHTAQLLLDILDRAPPEIFERYATAPIIRARLLVTLERFDTAREELIAIVTRLESQPPSPYTYRALSGCYTNLGFIGMLVSPYTRDYNYIHYFERAAHYSRLSGHKLSPPVSVASLGSYLCQVITAEAGEMERYIGAITEMVAYAAPSMGGCTYGMDDLARAELAFFREDLDRAEKMALTALEKAREEEQYEIENRALFYLLRVCLARGDYESIQDFLKQMDDQLNTESYLNRIILYDITAGWFYAQTGQTKKLASWLKNDFEESDLNSLVCGLEILVKAKYLFSEKRYPAALASLESRGDHRYGTGAFLLGKIEMKSLEAVCRYQLKDREGAFRALEAAYDLATPNSLYMPFTELGKDMRTLASALLKEQNTAIPRPWLERIKRSASAYAKRLFTVAEKFRNPASGEDSEQHTALLSGREIEVLTGFSQGLTMEEIAAVAAISINTVKSAARSIYNKLGAVNRADAIRIAATMGILTKGREGSAGDD
jgi:LuxR family maltose regulon positive regulatory protein